MSLNDVQVPEGRGHGEELMGKEFGEVEFTGSMKIQVAFPQWELPRHPAFKHFNLNIEVPTVLALCSKC